MESCLRGAPAAARLRNDASAKTRENPYRQPHPALCTTQNTGACRLKVLSMAAAAASGP